MRQFTASACFCATLLASFAAYAEDGGAAQAVSYTWTGLYGGINAGYGWGNSDWDFGAGGSNSHQDESGVVGLQFGYDAQMTDTLFAGLEASLDASGIDGKSACFGDKTCETHVSSLGDVSARLGVTSGETLFYAKAGIAYEDATHHIETPGIDNHDGGGAVFGYLIGGGAEYALTYNVTTKLEYNYMDFGSNGYTVEPGNTRISVNEPINLVKIGFNMKLN